MTNTSIDLSICIIGLNASEYLQKCLTSIETSKINVNYEIIYVDNHSIDDSVEKIIHDFPQVILIKNDQNFGFAKANNQAIQVASGKYFLLLNPDTLVNSDSIQLLLDYLIFHPETGIVGPKVLNSDGSFQPQCKRGEARPWEVICYFSRLSQLLPHNPHFSGYLQGHLDENQTHHVPAISGSCMLIRKEVIDQIGLLDEAFFAYQEDTDYCVRTRKAGWKVTYFPDAKITHFGGKGGAKTQPYRSIYEWHRSYFTYYKKHLAQDYFFLINWFFYTIMGIKLIISLVINFFRKEKHAGPNRG